MITATGSNKGNFKPIPEDVYRAYCNAIYDLGTQLNEKWGKTERKIVIQWTLPDETIEIEGEQKPRFISNTYTLSLHKKSNLRKVLESWRGKEFTEEELKGFDVSKLLKAPCQIQVIHKTVGENTYANIGSIMKLSKGMNVDEAKTATVTEFSTEGNNWVDQIEMLPEWIREKVLASEEYIAYENSLGDGAAHMEGDETIESEKDSDLPF